MPSGSHQFTFVGQGSQAELEAGAARNVPPGDSSERRIGKWRRYRGDDGVDDNVKYPNHPANYRARPDLVDAVNTALALSKPLLLTGNPGTGKSQLAERIAWELNLGPVLRFEAQSLSEANDLFYRFDLVGHLAAVEMFRSAVRRANPGNLTAGLLKEDGPPSAERFVKLGPLGEAIVRSNPAQYDVLFNAVFGPVELAKDTAPRQSVVLIDEIDKASRDFPNDLLNGIERLEFRIRELGLKTMDVNQDYSPIVIITSNSERDLPAPFLRRCTFFHIADPTKEELEQILAQRFFSRGPSGTGGEGSGALGLPPFYKQLLEAFWDFRVLHQEVLQYRPGTSELIDWTAALRDRGVVDAERLRDQVGDVRRTASSVSKHKEDQDVLREFLDGLKATTPTPAP